MPAGYYRVLQGCGVTEICQAFRESGLSGIGWLFLGLGHWVVSLGWAA